MFVNCSRSPKRSHHLRYVLRNKSTEDVYLVIVFALYLKEDLKEDGTLKEDAKARMIEPEDGEHEHEHDETEALNKAREAMGPPHHETQPDDVD